MCELCQSQAISPVTSGTHQTYSAVTGVMVAALIDSPRHNS